MNTPANTSTTPASCDSDGLSLSNNQPASMATIGVKLLNTAVCATPILLSAYAHTKYAYVIDSRAEYPRPIQAIGGIPRKFWVMSHGIERGTMNAVPAIIVETVSRMAPYFGNSRVASALCQPQHTAAPIIKRFPEMYTGSEEIVAEAIRGRRKDIFLVSKVLPSNASYKGTLRACDASLKRLNTGYLDVYLLHWWSSSHIAETMRAMEELVAAGKILHIGVSNLDVDRLKQAQKALTREKIACNQVLYHLGSRGIENSVLPYCESQKIAVVGYSPFGQGDFPLPNSKQGRALETIAKRYDKTPRQVALNFLTRRKSLFAIPKASRVEHVRENAGGAGWELMPDDLKQIDDVFPPPAKDVPLDMM